jgi:hypothetical protein
VSVCVEPLLACVGCFVLVCARVVSCLVGFVSMDVLTAREWRGRQALSSCCCSSGTVAVGVVV